MKNAKSRWDGANQDGSEETGKPANRDEFGGDVGNVMEPATFAFPLAFALIAGGVCGYFGKVSAFAWVMLLLTALSLQLVNNIARVYGDKLDRHDVRTEYYRLKFEKYRRSKRVEAPMQGAVADLSAIRLKTMLVACVAASLVLGYGLIVACSGSASAVAAMPALSCHVLAAAMLLARYLGRWCFGYRTYGNLVLFLLLAGYALGCLYLMLGAFVLPSVYPALGLASLGAAVANMRDLACERQDVEMSHTKMPRRTIPLSAGYRGAVIFQTVFSALCMIWLVAFPAAMHASHIWNFAFAVFYIPMGIDLASLVRARPNDVGALRRSVAISTVLLGIGFFLSLALANLV